jgi:hypothetical protein
MRARLLDQLADLVCQLGEAKLQMMLAVSSNNGLLLDLAQADVRRLRAECEQIKCALENHRAATLAS